MINFGKKTVNITHNSGRDLWIKSKKVIPTGNQLLSKRSERFLPKNWPSYYSKAKGCKVWDLDGNRYIDFAQMGVGTCTLGYSNRKINNAVINAVKKGSMCSLNNFEEVELAEKLVDLHPWADMARFSRSGGEACSVGIRIARAAAGKFKVAFCGYHGWHDWYISSNISNAKNLDKQLLEGLNSSGVPNSLIDTAMPFNYNDIESLEKIVKNNDDIGVIIMEPVRNVNPKDNFLQKVRDIANKINAVLIFDEVTSGFRINNGGIHLTYGVEPDMAIFGKALGNGHPISAVIGKESIMKSAETSFISSTFWTERVGFVAALKTLEIFEKDKVHNDLVKYGELINQEWENASKISGLKIKTSGIAPLTKISFTDFSDNLPQTFYTQEMLKKGYLLGAACYTTTAYSNSIIRSFGEATIDVFNKLAKHRDEGNLLSKLEGPIIESGFKRLN